MFPRVLVTSFLLKKISESVDSTRDLSQFSRALLFPFILCSLLGHGEAEAWPKFPTIQYYTYTPASTKYPGIDVTKPC